MSSYRFVHNKVFYVLDLLASLILLCLTICEEPCSPKYKVDPKVSAIAVSWAESLQFQIISKL
jgi:hypothetical protein